MTGTLYSEFEGKEQGIQEKATLLKGVSAKQRKLAFHLFTNRCLLVWLKGLALDPCNMVSSQHSIQMLQQELLKFRKSSMVCDLKYPKVCPSINLWVLLSQNTKNNTTTFLNKSYSYFHKFIQV